MRGAASLVRVAHRGMATLRVRKSHEDLKTQRVVRKWTEPHSPLVLDLMGLQVQVGVVCPGPRSRSGTTPDEYN